MGDRAILVVKDAPAALYLHWRGDQAIDILKAASPRMRQHDPMYAMARLIGVAHEMIDGALGMGVVPPPTGADAVEDFKEYSHGDAGVIYVDLEKATWHCYAGYLAKGKTKAGKLPNLSKE